MLFRSRVYVLWRFEGSVRRERIDDRSERFLRVFREPMSFEVLGGRLEEIEEDPSFVESAVADWAACGLLCEFSSS